MDIEVGPPPADGAKVHLVRHAGPLRVVVSGPLVRTPKRPIGFVDGLEMGLRPRARVEVWMTLLGAAGIRRPDLGSTGPGLEAQTGVVPSRIRFGHYAYPIHKPTSGRQVQHTVG